MLFHNTSTGGVMVNILNISDLINICQETYLKTEIQECFKNQAVYLQCKGTTSLGLLMFITGILMLCLSLYLTFRQQKKQR